MGVLGVDGFRDYLDYLEVHPDEFAHLFNMVLINVTTFFRDPEAWEFMRTEAIPRLLGGKGPHEPIRVWSAACSSGEEAYTLAMLLAEALGPDAFRERVKIYGTDVDEEALTAARSAIYPAKQVEGVPPELLERYFDRTDSHYVFRKDFRRAIIFGRNDLAQDSPISRIDLLTCRNALMYFNAETQARILARFHFALNDGGYLMLGRSETLLTHSNIFVPADTKQRVFTKVPRVNARERLLVMTHADGDGATGGPGTDARILEAAFKVGPTPQMLVNAHGIVVLANDALRALFGLSPRDLDRPLQDLELSYRPVELRSLVEQATTERNMVIRRGIDWYLHAGNIRSLDVRVCPVYDGIALLGTSITFTDVTQFRQLQDELRTTNHELETAYEELQSTVEELETTNEELQSTVEELETTNEELQSTAEELETMNEELQSTNEELATTNQELRQRGAQVDQANLFLRSVLNGLRGGVVVLDDQLRVQAWNASAEELWGMRAEEVRGRYFLNLDIGLPVEQLRAPMRACLSGEASNQEIVLDATNRRGRAIECMVTCTPLEGADGQVGGVILFMDPSGAQVPS
jgi:two-component system CheB/CheR fusion protein